MWGVLRRPDGNPAGVGGSPEGSQGERKGGEAGPAPADERRRPILRSQPALPAPGPEEELLGTRAWAESPVGPGWVRAGCRLQASRETWVARRHSPS